VARTRASAQVGLNGIVQGARFSEATLILLLLGAQQSQRSLCPQERSHMLQAMALRLNDEARRNQWETYSSSYSDI
jgi:hypothetical protein